MVSFLSVALMSGLKAGVIVPLFLEEIEKSLGTDFFFLSQCMELYGVILGSGPTPYLRKDEHGGMPLISAF